MATAHRMWVASGSATSPRSARCGIDWLLLDQEHAPNDLRTTLEQLQVLSGYPDVDVLVRPPSADPCFHQATTRHRPRRTSSFR